MAFKCLRWDKAMRICIGGDPKEPKRGRCKGDPIALNDEAFFLSKANQCAALDFMEEASAELRTQMSPIWRYCFVQWVIYDAGCEAVKNGVHVSEILSSKEMAEDVEALLSFCESGGLEKAKKSEKWTWKQLEKLPMAGTSEWGDDASPMVLAAKEERSDGCDAFNLDKFDKAFFHFSHGIRFLARLPEPLTALQSKLGCDLFKNIAATALKLDMNRVALNVASSAINLFPDDQKAWFRKACALQNLDRDEEAIQAFLYAGYAEGEKDLGPAVEPPSESAEIDQAMQESIEKLVFLECGIDSLAAVDMIALIQEELPVFKVPPSLVFTHPTVALAATFLVDNAKANEQAAIKTIYRSMCTVLNRDPVQVKSVSKTLPQEKVLGALLTLLESYESPEYVAKVNQIAKSCNYDYRSFLFQLRRHALEKQIQTLEIRGFQSTYEGMRKLECAVISCANKSKQVKELLKSVRVALYGGQDGMWRRAMEAALVPESKRKA